MALRVGLIGTGNISQKHLPAYRDYPEEIELTAVCDAIDEAAASVAEEFDVQYWNDFEDFVQEAPIDAVDIGLPHHLHYPAAREALEAGKHVFIEKPFAVSMSECLDLVELAESRERTLMIGQMQRFEPVNQEVKERLGDGELGQIHAARADGLQNLREYVDPPHWLYDGAKAGGGGVISVLVHKLDLLRYFIGDVKQAAALGKVANPDFQNNAEDYCVGIVEFENGAVCDLFSAYSAVDRPYGEIFWLYGESGAIHSVPTGEEYHATPRISDGSGFEEIEPRDDLLPTQNPFTNELLHFADCIETGREPLSSGRDNLGTMATIFALYQSLWDEKEFVQIQDVIDRASGQPDAMVDR